MATRRRRAPAKRVATAENFELSGEPLRLVSWEVTNILGIKAAYVDASGKHVVIIGGRNGQGKSSLLKALEMAIAGKTSFPLDPVHHGARAGTIRVKLSEITIDVAIDQHGNKLYVSDASGGRIKSPQTLLNTLFSELSFDPLHFAYMGPKEQDAELKRIGGLEEPWAKLDLEKEQVFSERTDINQDVKRYTAQLEGMPWHDDAPAEERSSKDVLTELDAQTAEQRSFEQAQAKAEALGRRVQGSVDNVQSQEQTVERLREELAEAERALKDARTDHEQLLAAEDAAVKEANAMTCPDTTATRNALATLEQDNQKVRENAARARVRKQLDEVEAEAAEKTERLKQIETEKAELLACARFPVEGLGFSDVGPTFNGVPLEQIAKSELVRLSCAIGFHQHPRLRLLTVKDAAFLDSDGVAHLEQLAIEHDGLIIMERVGTSDPCCIVIEDGTVVENHVAAE